MRVFKSVLFVVVLSMINGFWAQAQSSAQKYPIIPQPATLIEAKGFFYITPETIICYKDNNGLSAAQMFQGTIKELFGVKVDLYENNENVDSEKNLIELIYDEEMSNKEGYKLNITPDKTTISFIHEAGAFYAFQSLVQLTVSQFSSNTAKRVKVPAVYIEDQPKFAYRGLLLDVARHYLPIPVIEKYIDLMGHYKINNLHLHLTDDQGWRMEVKKYPKLHEIGSRREKTIVGHRWIDTPLVYDNRVHEGYYTQEELKRLVKYAGKRNVNIIPEIEMPGHSQATLAAYPELGCKDATYAVSVNWSVHKEILCPKEETFEFLQNVLLEVMEVFPSEYIHIGGDESPRDRWEESPFCQQLIQDKGLKDLDDLQNYFMNRMSAFLIAKGRKPIAWHWDGVHSSSLGHPPIIMPWVEEDPVLVAAKRGQYSIVPKNDYLYLDHYQTEEGREIEPLSIGGFLPLEKVYSFNPIPDGLTEQESKYILGPQACLWGEYVADEKTADYKLFPRLCAAAEVAWTDVNNKDYHHFFERLKINKQYLDRKGVAYRIEYFN